MDLSYQIHYINSDDVRMQCDYCKRVEKIRAVKTFNGRLSNKCCFDCLGVSGFLSLQECCKNCKECMRDLFPHLYPPVPLFSTHNRETGAYSSVSFDKGTSMTLSRGGAPPIQYKEDCILF